MKTARASGTRPTDQTGTPPFTMASDFSQKLQLAKRVTGSTTQKELHARFLAVNPETQFEPQRAYKWIQGRSVPRHLSVYADLARVLDLPVGGDHVRRCSVDAFRGLVEARHGPLPAARPETEPPHPGARSGAAVGSAPAGEAAAPLPPYLRGRYLTYSMAWSAARAGELILGCLTIDAEPDGRFAARYEERLPAGPMLITGEMMRSGRSLYALLANPADEMFIHFSFPLPPAPGLALAGTIAGMAYHDVSARPVAGRVFAIKVPHGSHRTLSALTGYAAETDAAIARSLSRAGFSKPLATTGAGAIRSFLTRPGVDGLVDVPATAVNTAVAPFYAAAGGMVTLPGPQPRPHASQAGRIQDDD